MRSSATRLLPATAASLLLAAALPAAAGDFSPKDSKATLTISWKITGEGDEIPTSKERHVAWKVLEEYSVTGTMTASAPSEYAAIGGKFDAADQKSIDARQASAQAAAKDAAPMMAAIEKAMAKCGGNEACIQQAAMAAAAQMDPKAMQSMRGNVDKAMQSQALRAQTFMGGTFTGTYRVQESAREAYFDAACGLRNEETCMIRTKIDGTGRLALDGKTTLPWGSYAQYDAKDGKLQLIFGVPAMAEVTKVVESKDSGTKSGTRKMQRQVPNGTSDKGIVVNCGQCKTARGTFELKMKDRIVGRPVKAVVDWTFRRP